MKNKLNPAITLYWDNQKSLLHFLPMPPSGRQLPECIFPKSSQPVSHWGGNHKVKKHTERRTHTYTHELWCNQEHHQTQMLLLTSDWDTAGGLCALVSVYRFRWQCLSVGKCLKTSRNIAPDKPITRWKIVSRGTAQGVAVTHTQ